MKKISSVIWKLSSYNCPCWTSRQVSHPWTRQQSKRNFSCIQWPHAEKHLFRHLVSCM